MFVYFADVFIYVSACVFIFPRCTQLRSNLLNNKALIDWFFSFFSCNIAWPNTIVADNEQLTGFSKVVMYSFFVGICIDSLTFAADEIIWRNIVVISQQSADVSVLHASRQLCGDVELISTQSYHSRRSYSVTTHSVETSAVNDLNKKLSCRRDSARRRSLHRSRSFKVTDVSIIKSPYVTAY